MTKLCPFSKKCRVDMYKPVCYYMSSTVKLKWGMKLSIFNENIKILIHDIINGMYDWVRVVNRENKVVYVNRAMEEAFKDCQRGEDCFKIAGRLELCENCISQKAMFSGQPQQKVEKINGRFFSIMCSPVKDSKGDIVASVEVLRDITDEIALQEMVLEQNKSLKDDRDAAKSLQCSLLPKGLPEEERIKISFKYNPCEYLGGDFVDFFKIDEDNLGIYIADVSGHGVPASLLTVFLRSTIDKKALSPAEALTSLFMEFNKNGFDHNVYMTVFYAIVNLRHLTITYSNAGHNVCPVVFNIKDNKRFEILMAPGIPISNWLEKPGYIDSVLHLTESDRLFFSTDGIIELKNVKGEQFGEDRLQNILLMDTLEPGTTLDKIIDSACEFAGIFDTTKFPDDITMALMEIKNLK